ncbi:MAG: site-2 protease family protein [Anaerolineae bacterium]
MRNSIKLFRVWGIEVGIDYSWFLIFFLLTWTLASQVFPDGDRLASSEWHWAMGILTSLIFFGCVLAHEFGHSVMALLTGVPVERITLFIFGGVAQIRREPRRALDEFVIAIAGPLVSLILALGFGALWLIGWLLELPSLRTLGGWLGSINLSLALFNLIPGFPLDGGRVLRAILWGVMGSLDQATRLAARVGQAVAYLFVFWGIWRIFRGDWIGGLWIAFIGWFLLSAALQSVQQVALRQVLSRYTARDVMMTDCPAVPPQLSLDVLVDHVILPSGRRCFPVMEDDALVGLITLHQIREAPQERWRELRVRDIMIPRERLLSARPTEGLDVVFERMDADGVNQIPVLDEHGHLVGLVARDRILSLLKALSRDG